ncbi:HlyD family secretion protein [Chitinophaga costaii]|uniref:HlyD family secretion protein n=1 Tax=Chitinophaga costaii TaxID=1335309 RepID=A0A1C4FRV4_9BACT|nr:efflux RND transporter periplasmic adaptor subunit [Chitinophaga costaii]PUZ20471.1 efflux RND transporter periplasmic adaptor subunit [Chitinophaga costaii]SCC58315.1 HlyD family secretion protein [Chitinophaga costaii]
MKKRTLYWIGGILVVIVLIIVGYKATHKDEGIKVATDKAATRDIIEVVSASGKIYPETEVKVSSDVSGEITDLLVMEGDSVKKGQTLARIYADIYGSQLDRATAAYSQSQALLANSHAALSSYEAKLAQAKAAYDRNKALNEQKVVSRSEFETAQANYLSAQADYNAALQSINSNKFAVASAQANVTEANKTLGRTTIDAPMSGVISLLSVKKGERVVGTAQMTGTEMLRIADLSVIETQVDVGENDVPKVHYGDTAIVEVDAYSDRKFKGIVTQIAASNKGAALTNTTTSSSSSAEQVTNYVVHIRLLRNSYADLIDPSHPKNFPFRPGMSASVNIQTRTHKNVLAVPVNAVTTREIKDTTKIKGKEGRAETGETGHTDDNKEVVFIVQKDGTVKQVAVTTDVQDDDYIEIKTGLKAGDEVVSAPYPAISRQLENGKKVKVVPAKDLFDVKK